MEPEMEPKKEFPSIKRLKVVYIIVSDGQIRKCYPSLKLAADGIIDDGFEHGYIASAKLSNIELIANF